MNNKNEDPQIALYRKGGETYRKAHDRVSICMRHQAKPCIGDPCDLDEPCKRHARTSELAMRVCK